MCETDCLIKYSNAKLCDAYKHIKPYIKEQKTLCKLCKDCKAYKGEHHNYDECVDEICFKCWLALVYLEWEGSYE